MVRDFNWYDDEANDCIAIRSMRAVAVYVNTAGDIVIRQEAGNGGEDDMVVVPVSFIPALTDAINTAVKESVAHMEE
jgi:hypothetical protein